MKIILLSLLCLVIIAVTSYSYAQQTSDDKNTELTPLVIIQLELRDSNGTLVFYTEADQILAVYPVGLYRFLDNNNQTRNEFLIKDGNKYDIYQWEQSNQKFDLRSVFSTTRLLVEFQDEYAKPIVMRHDSLTTEPGDVLRIFWTVLRPAS